MICLDSSVVLAELLAEDRHPAPSFWAEDSFVASRLLEYEVWTTINALGLTESRGERASHFLAGLEYLELTPPVLERALRPFSRPVRTLDTLHLASVAFLVVNGQEPRLATYDRRLTEAALAEGLELAILGEEGSA